MSDAAPSPDRALAALGSAIEAGRVLGLDVSRAAAVAAEARERLGVAPDAYVVALVGGTGVGKSTLLNALGGAVVSPAGVRRPTTGAPVAWVARPALDEVRPLLDRLGVAQVQTHARDDLRNLVILDLPDVDSLEASHRAAVEAVLPKLDVVAWVTDPEKYADAVLHDEFLREWMPRLDRQLVVLNKVDRLPDRDGTLARITADVRRTLPRAAEVVATTASDGEAGIADLRRWLAGAAEAKAIVVARLAAAARAAVADLATLAGVAGGEAGSGPLVSDADQRRAIDGATMEVLRTIDLVGAERQAVAATRARARRRGTGPIGLLTSALYRYSGRERRAADPAAYLRDWRSRSGLTRAAESVRSTVADVLPRVPPALRGRYAAASQAQDLEQRLGAATDRVIARRVADLAAPSSRAWPVIGLLQSANTLVLAIAAIWTVVWVIARPEVASYDLPVLGPVPAPLVLLAAGLVLGYILARALSIHAGWLGRRWATRISRELRAGVEEVVESTALAPVRDLEAARAALAAAHQSAGFTTMTKISAATIT